MLVALLTMLICVLALFILHRWLFFDKDCSQYTNAFTTAFSKKAKEK